MGHWRDTKSAAVALVLLGAALLSARAADQGSGLPVPRFVSLKSDRVNVRKGPGTDYPVAWIFEKVGLPVEIVKEFENWRQVRDSEGTEGWVLANLLSGRRTVLVTPWEVKSPAGAAVPKPTALHDGASDGSGVAALLAPGVMGSVLSCDGNWCQVSIASQRGYIAQGRLWGVYKGEAVR